MITFLRGRLAHALPTQATIDVGGVGYEVFIPLSSYDKLPAAGQPIEILTHLHVREDAQILYGFMTAPERDLFRLLVNHVSGIGPKLALAVLSGMNVKNFKAAVVNNDVASLSKISGVGKKTAERMVLELKDRVGVAAAWEAASAAQAPTLEQKQANEAVLALIALGYKQVDTHKLVRDLQEHEGAGTSAEELVKLALKKFATGREFARFVILTERVERSPPMIATVENKLDAIRDALPSEGLFAFKDWLISPDAFPISEKFASELEQLGHRLFVFQRACNQLYQLSVRGKQPAWIAQYLDAGKPT